MPIISEEDYLAHYGRKGMKWYQHIFGEEAGSRKQERLATKLHKQDVKTGGKFNRAANTQRKIQRLLDQYDKTGDRKLYKQAVSMQKQQQKQVDQFLKSSKILTKRYDQISKYTTQNGRDIINFYKGLQVKDYGNLMIAIRKNRERM